MSKRILHFAIPGDLDSPTGGYAYDRALIRHLHALGWELRHLELPGGFPFPDAGALAAADAMLDALPEGALVLADGLAFGVMDAIAQRHAARLRLVALVHHPLADETGLAPDRAARMMRSERAALACARAVICTSPVTARRLANGFGVAPARISVAVPGTVPGVRARGSGEVPLILSVGSLIPRKGHDVLIAALAGIQHLPWNARIVGGAHDPDTGPALAAQIGASGLEGRVVLTGAVADMEVEYLAADIFALATRHEGYGMAFAEALSHGLPVIGTRVGAVPDVVPAAAGRLVAPDDPTALRRALADLVSDRALRRAVAAQAWSAGQGLPGWKDTAAIVARTLDRVAKEGTP